MFENNTKGWHGSYSIVGKISAEKFHIILRKNEILEEKQKRKKVNSILFPSDSFDKKNKSKHEEAEQPVDIFENIPTKETNEKEDTKNFGGCSEIHRIKSEIFKTHYLHHQEIDKQIQKLKKHQNIFVNSMKYNPKMEYIWKRSLSGPKWNTISGREKGNNIYKNSNSVEIKSQLLRNIKLKKIIKNKNKKNKKNNNNVGVSNTLMNSIIMNKQSSRGILPTHYDHRIRNVKPFIITNLKKTKNKDNSIKKAKNRKNNLRISLSIDNSKSNNLPHSKSTKIYKTSTNFRKNNMPFKPYLTQEIKGINFSKIISRDQLNFIYRDKEGVHPFFIPNYEYVEPRSVSMVSYAKKIYEKSKIKRIKGVDPNVFFDPNKVINKYNNHIETNAPNFKIMVGRGIDNSPLPSYMINKFDRNSLNIITEKGLRMNNFLNSKFNQKFSIFTPKKSFNRLIKNSYLQDQKFSDNCINLITKECFNNKKLRKYIEYYNKDVNYYLEQNNIKRNFDGVTFTTYKDNIKKYKDKEFYEKCFNDKYNGFIV